MVEALSGFDECVASGVAEAGEGPPSSAGLTSGALAAQAGISVSTLRFYESVGLVAPWRSGRRKLYSAADRLRLETIVAYRRMGLPVADIATVLGSPEPGFGSGRGLGAVLKAHLGLLESRLSRLQQEIDGTAAALKRLRTDQHGR